MGNRGLIVLLLVVCIFGCKEDVKTEIKEVVEAVEEPKEVLEFGFKVDDFVVKKDTIRKGDSFGEILERNHVGYPKIFNIAEKAKDTFDIRRLQVGKPYTLLCAKDSLETP